MRNYQFVLVLKASLTEPQRKKIIESVKGMLKSLKITKEEDWGQKQLAYKIKREAAGYYFNFLLETDEKIPDDFEKKLFANEDILRHLLIRAKAKTQNSKADDAKKKTEVKKEKKEVKKKAK
ncbi:30S ribosomal protein S6 [Patescibacteria group bacterium]|nr:30S ribosomal protein S6 [Patescibacteria group bacterium]